MRAYELMTNPVAVTIENGKGAKSGSKPEGRRFESYPRYSSKSRWLSNLYPRAGHREFLYLARNATYMPRFGSSRERGPAVSTLPASREALASFIRTGTCRWIGSVVAQSARNWASPDFPDTFGSPIMGSEVKHGVTTAVQSRVQD